MVSGVAPGAKIIPIRTGVSVITLISSFNLANAIEYAADRGAHIVSISMGGIFNWRLRQAVLFGHSIGVQVALEFHRRHASRVKGLVLICGSYGNPLDTFHDSTVLKRLFPLLRRFPKLAEGAYTLVVKVPGNDAVDKAKVTRTFRVK